MNPYICDMLDELIRKRREEFWWLAGPTTPLPDEHIVSQPHGRFYESSSPLATERRELLLSNNKESNLLKSVWDDVVILYIGSLTDEEQIVFHWIRGDAVDEEEPLSRESLIRRDPSFSCWRGISRDDQGIRKEIPRFEND